MFTACGVVMIGASANLVGCMRVVCRSLGNITVNYVVRRCWASMKCIYSIVKFLLSFRGEYDTYFHHLL